MKTLTLKCTAQSQGLLTLSRRSNAGPNTHLYHIHSIPADITDDRVLLLANHSVFMRPLKDGELHCEFAELGNGKIVR